LRFSESEEVDCSGESSDDLLTTEACLDTELCLRDGDGIAGLLELEDDSGEELPEHLWDANRPRLDLAWLT
jgi:hypothetical protein